MHFIPAIALAAALVLAPETPAQDVSDFQPLLNTDVAAVEVDMASIFVRQNNGGFEVDLRLKMKLWHPFQVKGFTTKGAYYIDRVTAICKDNILRVGPVVLYDTQGSPMKAHNEPVFVANPKVPGTLVTDLLDSVCNNAKSVVPPLTI